MVRVLGIGMVGTLLAMTLSRHNGGYGLLTGLATGALLLVLLLNEAEPLSAYLGELTAAGSLSAEYMGRVLRILGLACLTETGSRVCKDGGQGNIALKVELCGRALILCAMVPVVREMLGAVGTVLAEIGP